MAEQAPAKSVWVEFISKFETKNLKDAEKQISTTTKALRKMGKAAAVAFAAAAAGLALMAREVLKLGDAVDKQSKQIGESEEGYQKMASIFGDMGISAQTASKGILFLRKELGRGEKASIEFRDALKDAGIKPEELAGKDAFGQYKVLIDKLRGLEGETQTSVAQATLGRAGKELGKVLNAAPEALDEALQRYIDKGGPLFFEGEAERVATIKDELGALNDARKKIGKEVVFAVFGEVDPQDIREITKTFAGMAKWVRENSKLVKGLVQAFFALMAAIAAIGTVASYVAIAGTVLGKAFIAAAGAAITPILAIAAAIAGVGLAVFQVITYWDDLGRSIAYVWEQAKGFFASTAGKAFNFVSNTLGFGGASPDVATAGAPSAEQVRGATNTTDNSQTSSTYNITTTMNPQQLEAFLRKRDAKQGRAGQR